jgi:phosphoglycolate phosphatase
VLVDSRRAFARCVNHALASNGVAPRPEAELHAFLGPPLHPTFTRLAGEALADACVEAYRERYRTHAAGESDVFPGLADALEAIDDELIVVTSKPHALAEPLLRALGLRSRFAAVFGPSLAERAEPKSATLARALREHAPRALVGDRSFDVHAAREHGICAIGVLWGIGTETELRAAGADTIVRTPADLAGVLRSAGKGEPRG